MPPPFPPTVFAIRPLGGLGSRLRCIASFGVLAQHFGVPLRVCWTASAGFEEIELDQLFDALPRGMEIMKEADWKLLRTVSNGVHLDKHISYLSRDYKYSFFKLEHLFQTRKPLRVTAECARDLQQLYGAVLHRFIPNFRSAYFAWWREFVPCVAVRECVGAEVAQWDAATSVVGVHVRRNDALQSPLAHKYSRPTVEEVDTRIGAHLESGRTVFLATDDADVHARLHGAHGDHPRFRTFPWRRYAQRIQERKSGQRKALVDLWTLRACDTHVKTHFSVFSEVACILLPWTRGELVAAWAPVPGTGLLDTDRLANFDDESEPAFLQRERQARADALEKAAAEAKDAATRAVEHARTMVGAAHAACTDAVERKEDAHAAVGHLSRAVREAMVQVRRRADRAWFNSCRKPVAHMLVRKRVLGACAGAGTYPPTE